MTAGPEECPPCVVLEAPPGTDAGACAHEGRCPLLNKLPTRLSLWMHACSHLDGLFVGWVEVPVACPRCTWICPY